jgi:hypothetical protein
MTKDVVQVRAEIPRDLKRKAFATFALTDEKFNRWLQRALEEFVQHNAALGEYLRGVPDLDEAPVTVPE